MKYELWILAAYDHDSLNEPYVSLHATHAEALRGIVRDYRNSIESESAYTDAELDREAFVRDVLTGIVEFTIEPAVAASRSSGADVLTGEGLADGGHRHPELHES